MLLAIEMTQCPNLDVPVQVMQHVVQVESSYNPYAIGIVGGALVRQPGNLAEALATVKDLEQRGYNFSVGLAQINRYNLAKYGLASYEQAFSVCPNLQVGTRILSECHARAHGDWGKAFSCYYSGNFSTGYQHGYVDKVFASMRAGDASPVDSGPVIALARPSQSTARRSGPALSGLAASRADLMPQSISELPADPAFVLASGLSEPGARVSAHSPPGRLLAGVSRTKDNGQGESPEGASQRNDVPVLLQPSGGAAMALTRQGPTVAGQSTGNSMADVSPSSASVADGAFVF